MFARLRRNEARVYCVWLSPSRSAFRLNLFGTLYFGVIWTLQKKALSLHSKQGAPFGFQVDVYLCYQLSPCLRRSLVYQEAAMRFGDFFFSVPFRMTWTDFSALRCGLCLNVANHHSFKRQNALTLCFKWRWVQICSNIFTPLIGRLNMTTGPGAFGSPLVTTTGWVKHGV